MEVLFVCNMHANYSHMRQNKKNSADNMGLFIFIFYFFNGMFTDQSARCIMVSLQWRTELTTAGNNNKKTNKKINKK